jgi:transcriptional regulator with XRE-family HTH domain
MGSSVEAMDRRRDVQDFLASRRARLTPEQAGLVAHGERRRVKGLRREEVAMLAGVSVDYYARLERGNLAGASESVLEAVAGALQLDDAERQHLHDLARNSEPTPSRRRNRPKEAATPRPAVMAILAGMTAVPAYVRNARMDILAANELCRALWDGRLDEDKLPLNLARYVFLEPHSRGFFLDWDTVADDLEEFSSRWSRQNVKLHRTARKRLHNRIVGDIELTGDALELVGDGLTLIVYTADADSLAADQLRLLATWQATQHSSARADTRSAAATVED